jgi:hypothetical protein
VYNKDTVGFSSEQRWFNLFVDIQAQQDAPTQDKDKTMKKCMGMKVQKPASCPFLALSTIQSGQYSEESLPLP